MLQNLAHLWNESNHENGVDSMVIMHNMIMEDEKFDSTFNHKYFLELYTTYVEPYQVLYPLTFEWFAQKLVDIEQ